MKEEKYFEYHLKTIWKLYSKFNVELYGHQESGSLYEELPINFKSREIEFIKLTNYEGFYDFVIKKKNRYVNSLDDFTNIKNILRTSLKKCRTEEFVQEYVNEVVFNSDKEFSKSFIENEHGYRSYVGYDFHLKEILPKMSYENALCYLNTVNTWTELNLIPLNGLIEKPYGKDLLYFVFKNCYTKDNKINSDDFRSCVNLLIDNYPDKDLKIFDFLDDIKSFLLSKNKPKDIVTNQNEEVFTTKISIDCQHAMNLYRVNKSDVNGYIYLIDTLSEHLVKDSSNNIIDINNIHKFDKDDAGINKKYIISNLFIDTKEYDPDLKKRLSNLFNKYIEDYTKLKDKKISEDAFQKFTQNWLLQENLQSELKNNSEVKTKIKKI
jgi:hypothetical protein